MKLTIGKKLTACFLGLAVLVLLSGVTGYGVLDKVSASIDTVAKEKTPIQYALMKASLAVEKTQKAMNRYINASSDLESQAETLMDHIDEYGMWIQAVHQGSNSKEFLESVWGRRFRETGLDISIPRGTGIIGERIQGLVEISTIFKTNCSEVIAAHNRYMSYSFSSDGKTHTLPAYLNIMNRFYLEWVKKLKDAVNIVTLFTGETDPSRHLLSRWIAGYTIDNPDVMALLTKMKKYHEKLLALALSINQTPEYEKKLKLFNRGIGSTARIENCFSQLHSLAEPLYKDLETVKQERLSALVASAATINRNLDSLMKEAEIEVKKALAQSDTARDRGVSVLLALTLAAVIVASVLGLSVSRVMSGNISRVAEATRNISRGDLRESIKATARDELGDLARDTNTMIENLKEIIGRFQVFSNDLSISSGDLDGLSTSMSQGSEELETNSEAVTRAADTMSSFMTSVAAACEQAAANVNSVSAAAGNITTSITEIARSSEQGSNATTEAVHRTTSASKRIDELTAAAREINKVTEIISEISEQTNLLALNATIEAARAGQAGKGFAVVASEIKELARQTANATNDIRTRIETIQGTTTKTVEDIQGVAQVITSVNDIVTAIAASAEEQARTTREIADNMTQAAGGLQEVNENVSKSAGIADTIARDITNVNAATRDVRLNTGEIREKASTLAGISNEIESLIQRFKL